MSCPRFRVSAALEIGKGYRLDQIGRLIRDVFALLVFSRREYSLECGGRVDQDGLWILLINPTRFDSPPRDFNAVLNFPLKESQDKEANNNNNNNNVYI